MKIALATLGCKLNQAESELLASQFAGEGHTLVSSVEEADIYVLNTCTVTHTADSKSRHLLRLANRRNPDALLVVTGCYAHRVPQEVAKIPGVSLVVGNDEKPQLLKLLQGSGFLNCLDNACGGVVSGNGQVSRTRAFIKIQDGCSNSCTYCVVPLVRGREKSQPVGRVLTEVRQRVAEGYQEVVLTGTEVGSYHSDGTNLKGLLERVLAVTSVVRLRLSSIQPQEVNPGFIGLWDDRRLCPHFHLSLQSGNDGVLRRMWRHYNVVEYQEAVSLIRRLVPDVAITTDIIVGFPGETDEEFEESYRLCRQLGFARIHVFPYSARPGTGAAKLPGKVGDRVKRDRVRKMLALAEESARNFRRKFAGRIMPVLWEQKSAKGLWSGLTVNYIEVNTNSEEDLTNRILPARITPV